MLDSRGDFCPPAAVRLGIAAQRLVVIHPGSVADHHWAMNQALRFRPPRPCWPGPQRSTTALSAAGNWRRRKAAVSACCPARAARAEPSWADVRLLVEPRGVAREGRGGEGIDPGRVSMTNLQFAICNLQSSPPPLPSPLSPLPAGGCELRCCGAAGESPTAAWTWNSTMRRILCIRLPDWPHQRHAVASPRWTTARHWSCWPSVPEL